MGLRGPFDKVGVGRPVRTPIVDDRLGEAFHIVEAVHAHLDELETIAALGEDIPTVVAGFASINASYDMAVAAGFVGTQNEWLAQLNGASAYELALQGGFVGTLAEWRESLKGEPGDPGLQGDPGSPGAAGPSAYEHALSEGFVGTLAAWLQSLRGQDGQDGQNGIDGIDGQNGQDGIDGLSAYEVAVANGYVGSQTDWLLSLKGAKGDPGDPGEEGSSVTNFLALTDTPDTFLGKAGMSVRVSADETALEYFTAGEGSSATPYQASATLWRLLVPFDATAGYNFVGFGEIQFKNDADTNLSLLSTPGSASYSSGNYNDTTFDDSKAFDGVLPSGDNGWLSKETGAAVGHWIAFESPTTITPTKVTIYPRATYTAAMPSKFVVQFSVNGVDWKTVKKFTTATAVVGSPQTFDIPLYDASL
jgi:hypothetical protein